jgi:hypothetical protein
VLADLAMLAELEQIQLAETSVQDNRFDLGRTDPLYAQAFRNYGIDVEALPVAEAAARIRARPIGAWLAAALDHWASDRQERESSRSQ